MKTTFTKTAAAIATLFAIASTAVAQVPGEFDSIQSAVAPRIQTQPQIELAPRYTPPIAPQVQVAPAIGVPQHGYVIPPVEIVPPVCDFLPRLQFDGREIHGVGMQVVHVQHGGVAERIGLEAGDIIVKIDGRRMDCVTDYENALAHAAIHGEGHVDLVVRNIRYRPGCSLNREFVAIHADLPRRCIVPVPAVAAAR